MRIAEQRGRPCSSLLMAGVGALWIVLALSFGHGRPSEIGYIVAGLAIILVAAFQHVDDKQHKPSFLETEEAPQPRQIFRARIDTQLKRPPAECRIVLLLEEKPGITRKYAREVWRAEATVHPVHGEHSYVLPVEFDIPSDLAGDLEPRMYWRVRVKSIKGKRDYHATFALLQ